jgi:hypothetical protein
MLQRDSRVEAGNNFICASGNNFICASGNNFINASKATAMTYPRTFSHIGLSVTDLDQAVDFYSKVFGWYVIMAPSEIVADDSAIGVMCTDVFGEGWGSFRIAHMSTGDRTGVEIFEFKNAVRRENNFEYWRCLPRCGHHIGAA